MTIFYNKSEAMTKAKTYIGFAKKSGKLKIGTDNILACKKLSGIIISCNISDNAKNKLKNHCNKLSTKILEIDDVIMNKICDSESIKAIAILDKNLHSAFVDSIKNLEETTVE